MGINSNNIYQGKKNYSSSRIANNTKPISKITQEIGSGDDAKNSIVYLVLKWAFYAAVIISLAIVANYWFFRENEKVPDFINDIKIIWEVVVPIITLTLGYAFGKSEK